MRLDTIVEELAEMSIASPSSSSQPDVSLAEWTPGSRSVVYSDSDEELEPQSQSVTDQFNQAMKTLSEAARVDKPRDLCFQLTGTLESASSAERRACVETAVEACNLVCTVIASNDAENLFHSLPREDQGKHLLPLVNAFVKAPTQNLKTQILSIYAYEMSIRALQKLHEPFGGISH